MLRTPGGVVLIDAGLGPRMTRQRMNGTGVKLTDVRAICLTHLDSDHYNSNWMMTAIEQGIRIHCAAARVSYLLAVTVPEDCEAEIFAAFAALIQPFDIEPFEIIDAVRVSAVDLAHDRAGCHAFLVEGFGQRIGYATDLGHVPSHLIERFCDLDVLAIESNYDPTMQIESTRPAFMKNRIMGGAGHLSNEQALEAIRNILDRCQQAAMRLPSHIVLLHRSRQCNCPKLLRSLFSRDVRIAPRLVLAEQFQRSDWMRPRDVRAAVGEQLTLQWG
jgi:phosphoribosyl 1,2-cyclic phosphodiesterase